MFEKKKRVPLLSGVSLLALTIMNPAIDLVVAKDAMALRVPAAQTFTFEIASKPLLLAFADFTAATHIQIVRPSPEGIRGVSSTVQGTLTAQEALVRLLAGTGLTYQFTAPNTVTVGRPVGEMNTFYTDPGAVQLQTIDVQGEAAPLDTPAGTTGYVATRETAATKTITSVREVPQSVSTVTRQQLNDRDVQTLGEAINYTPSASTNVSGTLSDFDRIYIRGFAATTDVYRDGLRQGGAGYGVPKVEPYGLESLAILRGPASGLYGLASPGGIIDVVTKRPTATPFGEVQLQIGQYNRYQGNFDFGGPVPGHDDLSYRLTGLFRNSDTNLPGEKDNRDYIAPAFRWQVDADTSITLLAEYEKSRTSANDLWYSGIDHKIRYYANDPRYGAFDQEQERIGYEFEHRFSNLVTIRQKARFYHVYADAKWTGITSVNEATQTAARYAGHDQDVLNSLALDNQAEFHFNLGEISNTLLTGLNYNHLNNISKYATGSALDLNLVTLNYGAQPISPANTFTYNTRQILDEVGVYAQEQARLGGFLLTLNGQEAWASNNTITSGTIVQQDDAAFTGRAGLSYLFDNGVTPYISYASSYDPQLGTTASGSALQPSVGTQKEAGIKYQMPNMPVLLSAAVFDIKQSNVSRTDPSNSAFQIATGQVESKGVELEANVALAEGFNLTASYSHLDVKIVQGETDTTGKKFSGIPEDSAALFAKYTFQPGLALEGLGIGAGVRYKGGSWGDDQNTFRNSPVALMDAVLDYDLSHVDARFKGVRLQVNATNLLATRYQSCLGGYCGLGEPQRIIGSMIYRF